MRKPSPPPVSAPPSTSTPLIPQHTHEVILRNAGTTVVIRCFGIDAAERTARWERRAGVDVEIVAVVG